MSEQAPQPEDTPTPASPEEVAGTAAQEIPEGYIPEDRYREVQAWATRSAQEASELRALKEQIDDPEQFQRLLEERGYFIEQPPEEEMAGSGTDPQLLSRLEALEQERQAHRDEQERQQQYAAYREHVDPQLKGMGVPEDLVSVVADTAQSMPLVHTPHGQVPDLEGALKQIEAAALAFSQLPDVRAQMLKKWQGTKQTHHISPNGGEGLPLPDLTTREGRDAHVLGLLAQEED